MSDARKFQRTDFGVKGTLNQGGNTWDFRLLNLSLKGLLMAIDPESEPQSDININIIIQLNHSDVQIRCAAQIVHHEMKSDELHLGCKFEEIDPESMIHLRRLLELNTIPEGEIERELSFLKD